MPDDFRARARLVPKGNRYEDFEPGRVFRHHWGRTITESDIMAFAGLSPYAQLGSLGGRERAALLESVRAVLAEATEVERRRAGGLPTRIGDHFAVHGRYGRPCPRCGEDLRRVSYESHEVTYCPHCQTGDKVLADRRLSRLVK